MSECKKIDCCPADIYGYQPTFTATATFTALCPVGETGEPVTVEKTATSQISYQDAYDTALAEAQAEAEAEIVCEEPPPDVDFSWELWREEFGEAPELLDSGVSSEGNDAFSTGPNLLILNEDAVNQAIYYIFTFTASEEVDVFLRAELTASLSVNPINGDDYDSGVTLQSIDDLLVLDPAIFETDSFGGNVVHPLATAIGPELFTITLPTGESVLTLRSSATARSSNTGSIDTTTSASLSIGWEYFGTTPPP